MNLILGAVTGTSYFNPGFAGQPILAGEGNTDSAVTVLGLMAGAAFAHNFGLASSGEGRYSKRKDRSYYWDCGSCCNCGSELHEKRRILIVGIYHADEE